MPRRPRTATGGYVYHVLNRAVGRATIFQTVRDYAAFEQVLREAGEQVPGRLLAYCLMPNHWHLVLWPFEDGDLSQYMCWLTNTQPETEAELAALRRSASQGTPFGETVWQQATAERLDLLSTLRASGRPRKPELASANHEK